MAPWGWIAGGYGVFLTFTALGPRGVANRSIALAACVAYTLIAVGSATIDAFWVHLLVPGALLLGGYRLSGLFFHDTQPWLEEWLLASDRRLFERLDINRFLARAPMWVLELLEASYTADYIVVGGGALVCAALGGESVVRYWTLVLGAELACYAALPYLRSRPPRALEPPGVMARRAPRLRRLNAGILDRASVQANTIPSGHVAGALAAALAILPVTGATGWIFLAMAPLIAVSATVGRYHYAVDCIAGGVVAIIVWSVM